MSTQQTTPDSDSRGTPPWLIRKLQAAIGGLFDLDPAAGAGACQISRDQFTVEDDGLAQVWTGQTVFLNPPYSDPGPWIQKAVKEYNRSRPDSPQLIVCLLPAYTASDWFQTAAGEADQICFLDNRISFVGQTGTPPFSNLLVTIGDTPDQLLQTLQQLGQVYNPQDGDGTLQTFLVDKQTMISDGATTPTKEQTYHRPPELNLGDVIPREQLTITFDRDTLGFPGGIPEHPTVTVLNRTTPEQPEGPEGVYQVATIHEKSECWISITQSPTPPHDISVAVARDANHWRDVSVKSITHQETGSTQ